MKNDRRQDRSCDKGLHHSPLLLPFFRHSGVQLIDLLWASLDCLIKSLSNVKKEKDRKKKKKTCRVEQNEKLRHYPVLPSCEYF